MCANDLYMSLRKQIAMLNRIWMILMGMLMIGQSDTILGQELKVMTYNIRFDNPEDRPFHWIARLPLIKEQLYRFQPDIFGVHEALKNQVEALEQILENHIRLGVGRDDGIDGGEFCPLFLNHKRFTLKDNGTIWLAESKDTSARGWDAALPRIATWALAEDRTAGIDLMIINTHFDHIGRKARSKSMQLIYTDLILKYPDVPVIFMGDLNCNPQSEPYIWLAVESNMLDSYQEAWFRSGPTGTFNAFNYDQAGDRIDYIFVSPHFAVTSYQVWQESYEKVIPSDHWPVLVTLQWKK
jgi:endonuclease/exonuclease/phosphatase family metal-dependent hydrolase